MPQPNILLIHSDQHRFDCVGANGNAAIRTPALDRLAAEGVNFTQAYTPVPICSPERASLLTGLWPTQHGCLSIPNTEPYRPSHAGLPLFSPLLREAGYRLGYVSKYHNEIIGDPRDAGFHEYIPLAAYARWRAEQGLPPAPRENGWFGEVDLYVTPEQTALGWGASHTVRMLEQAGAADTPFFIRWDPQEPHLPCRPPREFAERYTPESVPPWPSFPDPLDGKPYIQAQQRRTWKTDGWTWEQWAPVVARYYAEISLLDAQIGRILDTLDRLGLAENTLVIYTTDHGDLCGGHGMMDKHFVMYDDVVRVPLLARFPGRLPAGVACDAFSSHAIDLAVTFCEVAGVAAPGTFQGRSLLAMARGEDPAPRPDIFGMYHGCQFGLYSQRMVRDRRWKYVWNCTAEDELYDLETDPGELRNRAGDPACAGELRRLRLRVIDWMASINDPLLNPWTRAQLADGLTTEPASIWHPV